MVTVENAVMGESSAVDWESLVVGDSFVNAGSSSVIVEDTPGVAV